MLRQRFGESLNPGFDEAAAQVDQPPSQDIERHTVRRTRKEDMGVIHDIVVDHHPDFRIGHAPLDFGRVHVYEPHLEFAPPLIVHDFSPIDHDRTMVSCRAAI
jgi:hypothetical protein